MSSTSDGAATVDASTGAAYADEALSGSVALRTSQAEADADTAAAGGGGGGPSPWITPENPSSRSKVRSNTSFCCSMVPVSDH
jgi:hypothetical protein